tara:strand:- start:184 stop:378 length:195 start_codon:yes stop_codon:yes gene_type:complete
MHVFPGLEGPDRLLRHAAKLIEIFLVVVSDFYDEQMVSGKISWQFIQGLSDARVERLSGKSSSH